MQPILFVMAIMGCGDGNTACREVRTLSAGYTTLAECRAALPDQLARNTDMPFPVIGAKCQRASNRYAANSTPPSRG